MAELSLIQQCIQWHLQGKKIAVATVIQTWNSSPKPCGSQMFITADGQFCGSVSGGCVEAAVIKEAQAVIASEEAKTLEFGVAHETAFAVGLSCGGRIKVHIDVVSG